MNVARVLLAMGLCTCLFSASDAAWASDNIQVDVSLALARVQAQSLADAKVCMRRRADQLLVFRPPPRAALADRVGSQCGARIGRDLSQHGLTPAQVRATVDGLGEDQISRLLSGRGPDAR